MTLKAGEIVTSDYLESLFTRAVLEYNSFDYTQISSLTSGQVRYVGSTEAKSGDYLNVYSEQSYAMDQDMDIFKYLEERVSKIEGRT